MTDFEQNNEQNATKPSYDGRQVYFEVVKTYMAVISQAQFSRDFCAWERSLRGLYSLVRPYILDDKDSLVKDMERLSKDLLTFEKSVLSPANKKVIEHSFDDRLQKIQDKLYLAAKYMLLPTGGDAVTEYDTNDFLAGSD